MRISTSLMYENGIAALLDQQDKLHKTQLQLSSGKRVLKPSDDPAASALTVELDQAIESYNQYLRNIDSAESRLKMEESALAEAGNILQRARELAIQGNGGALGAENRRMLAEEVKGLLESMVGLANSKDGNGDYLFAGFMGGTIPFVDAGGGDYAYQGDHGQRELRVGPSRTVADSDSGYDVFMDVRDNNGNPQSIFRTLSDLYTELNTNSPNIESVGDLDNAMDKILEIRAKIGARLNALDVEKQRNDSTLLPLKETKSKLNDLDYAEAVGRLSVQLAGLEAAQKSFTKVQGLSLFDYL